MRTLEDIGEFFAGIFFSLNRRMILKRIGTKLLGEKYAQFGVLEMADVCMSSCQGFFADKIARILFGTVWAFVNWIAAARAYLALEKNRDIPVKIVFMTLLCKDAPKEVWQEFYKRNPEALKYKKR